MTYEKAQAKLRDIILVRLRLVSRDLLYKRARVHANENINVRSPREVKPSMSVC